MSMSLDSFFQACLLMGLGIGIDVAIATALRTEVLKQQRIVWLWVAGVTLTHTLFPMAGYLLTYFSIQTLPTLTPLIGILAFALIVWFLWEELFANEEESEHQNLIVTVGIILAVSWDALWSGPAKSAQIVGWSDWQIWSSFILVGLVVMAFAILAFRLASAFCHYARLRGNPLIFLQWVQYSVIGYFGLLALFRYTLASEISDVSVFMVSMAITSALMATSSVLQQPQNA